MKWIALLCLTMCVWSCTPTLDWREVRPPGSAALVLFPCKPATQTRMVTLAGARTPLTLSACDAGGSTYAFAHADMRDRVRVGDALDALAAAAAGNIGATLSHGDPVHVPGMSPEPRARRFGLQGRRPGGDAVREQVVVFARGTHVYQATVLGPSPPTDAVNAFFESLRLAP